MPRESNAALLQQLALAYEALGEAIALAKKGKGVAFSPKKPRSAPAGTAVKSLDFSIPMRAFVKKYGKGLSGSRKFTLLVAYLAKGDTGKKVTLIDVEQQWNRMTAKGRKRPVTTTCYEE